MAGVIDIVNYVLPTSGGGSDSVSLNTNKFLGYTPKAVICYGTSSDGDSDGVANFAILPIGFWVNGTNYHAGCSMDNAVITANTERWHGNDRICLSRGNGTTFYSLSVASVSANTINLTIHDYPAASKRIFFVAIGGDDDVDVELGSFAINAGTGNQTVNLVDSGLLPDFGLFISARKSGGLAATSVSNNAVFSYGFGVGSGSGNYVSCLVSDDGTTGSDSYKGSRNTNCVDFRDADTSDNGYGSVSFNTGQIIFNRGQAFGNTYEVIYLVVKGFHAKAGNYTRPSSAGSYDHTGLTSFKPTFGFFINGGHVTSFAWGSGNAVIFHGVDDGDANRASYGVTDNNLANPTETRNRNNTTYSMVRHGADTPNNISCQSYVSAWLSTGMTKYYASADGFEDGYLLIRPKIMPAEMDRSIYRGAGRGILRGVL